MKIKPLVLREKKHLISNIASKSISSPFDNNVIIMLLYNFIMSAFEMKQS